MNTFYNQPHNSRQKTNQTLVMDQNYSNNILCSCLSSLQSLAYTYLGDPSQLYKNKMFKSYDVFDYSNKSRLELKNQVVTNLMILKASFQIYKHSYPNQKWIFPANLSYNQFMSIVNQMKNIFSQYKDQQAWNLANDLSNLINGTNQNSYFEANTFSIPISNNEKSINQKNMFQNGYQASVHMEKQAERVKDVKDISELTVKINQGNHFDQIIKEQDFFIVCDTIQNAKKIKFIKTLQEISINHNCQIFKTEEHVFSYIFQAKRQKYYLNVKVDQTGKISHYSQILLGTFDSNNKAFRQQTNC